MPSKTDFNVSPYYDDFAESKKFHRVMYRPSYAVQARELTTQQSIIQNQIDLIKIIRLKQPGLNIAIAPETSEIEEAKKISAISITNDDKCLNIMELAGLIKKASYVIANDTGPAHMAAHLNAKGLTLFGSHTTAYKVDIERENFKAIQVADLKKLTAAEVFEKIEEKIN